MISSFYRFLSVARLSYSKDGLYQNYFATRHTLVMHVFTEAEIKKFTPSDSDH